MQATSQPLASEVGLLSFFLKEALGEEKMVPEDASSVLLYWR